MGEEEKEKRGGMGRGGENVRSRGGEGGWVVLGDAGSGNLNPGRRREGKVDWSSINVENKGDEERGKRGEKRGRGGQNERRGRRGMFLAIQVLEIPAGGRGFPLVSITHVINTQLEKYRALLSRGKMKIVLECCGIWPMKMMF